MEGGLDYEEQCGSKFSLVISWRNFPTSVVQTSYSFEAVLMHVTQFQFLVGPIWHEDEIHKKRETTSMFPPLYVT